MTDTFEARSSTARLRVLVADDNEEVAETLCLLIERLGHEARSTIDGEQALSLIEQWLPDIAFMDVLMPCMDGLDVATRVRASHAGSDITLVAISGLGTAADQSRALDAGFDLYIVKPLGFSQLQSILTSVGSLE